VSLLQAAFVGLHAQVLLVWHVEPQQSVSTRHVPVMLQEHLPVSSVPPQFWLVQSELPEHSVPTAPPHADPKPWAETQYPPQH
jgi:hypothetical protein